MDDRVALSEAFSPHNEIQDPTKFAGRIPQLAKAVDALNNPGTVIVIHGARGIGKSSLARQVSLLDQGDTQLKAAHRLDDGTLDLHFQYQPFYVPCTNETPNTTALLSKTRRLIAAEVDVVYKDSGKSTTTRGWSLFGRLFGVNSAKSTEMEDPAISTFGAREDEMLTDILSRRRTRAKLPALIIFDEVDVMRDMSGLAHFIKTIRSEIAQFILVGVAASAEQLVADHQSIGHRLRPIEVPPMRPDEAREIFDIAAARLLSLQANVAYSPETVGAIIDEAGGFPYTVQALGRDSGVECLKNGRVLVTREHLGQALLFRSGSDSWLPFENSYRQAVGQSSQRAEVLDICAAENGSDVPINFIYTVAKERYRNTNPYQTINQLTADPLSSVLIRVPGATAYIRFRDPLLKWYIRRRPDARAVARAD
ncbi:MAG: ATP-binding protein [Candidatus Dormibacteraeota bacterium]|nr:ATP-binding protein [Candidatus Dormibacteraeota bacterium]